MHKPAAMTVPVSSLPVFIETTPKLVCTSEQHAFVPLINMRQQYARHVMREESQRHVPAIEGADRQNLGIR